MEMQRRCNVEVPRSGRRSGAVLVESERREVPEGGDQRGTWPHKEEESPV